MGLGATQGHTRYVLDDCTCVSVFDPWISNILNHVVDFVDEFSQSQKDQSVAAEQ